MGDDVLRTDRERLTKILARDEFADQSSAADGIWAWISEIFDRLLSRFPDVSVPGGAGEAIVFAVYAALIAIVLIMLWRAVRRFIRARKSRSAAPLSFAGERAADADEYLRTAEQRRREGRFAEAVRFAFLAGLLRLDERGSIRAEKWKTNREYAEELHEVDPVAVSRFIECARLFEQVWYGGKDADETDYLRITAWLDEQVVQGEGVRRNAQ